MSHSINLPFLNAGSAQYLSSQTDFRLLLEDWLVLREDLFFFPPAVLSPFQIALVSILHGMLPQFHDNALLSNLILIVWHTPESLCSI